MHSNARLAAEASWRNGEHLPHTLTNHQRSLITITNTNTVAFAFAITKMIIIAIPMTPSITDPAGEPQATPQPPTANRQPPTTIHFPPLAEVRDFDLRGGPGCHMPYVTCGV
jgi:hypothetical protein